MSRVTIKHLILWLVLATGIVFGLGSINWLRFYRLANVGVAIQGRVTAKEPQNHQNVHYTYSVESQMYDGIGHAGFGNPEFGEVKVGDQVGVFYLPTKPAVSCLGTPKDLLVNETIPIGLAALLMPPFVIWANTRRKNRR